MVFFISFIFFLCFMGGGEAFHAGPSLMQKRARESKRLGLEREGSRFFCLTRETTVRQSGFGV